MCISRTSARTYTMAFLQKCVPSLLIMSLQILMRFHIITEQTCWNLREHGGALQDFTESGDNRGSFHPGYRNVVHCLWEGWYFNRRYQYFWI